MLETFSIHTLLVWIQKATSLCGVLVIFFGVIVALLRYLTFLMNASEIDINQIRLKLGRILTLGLEFIVAADLIGTTTAPDYYTVGIVASIVIIRTILSYTLNREIESLSKQETNAY